MWFNEDNININKNIILNNLEGYVLPHASTEFTGEIISHTLRFKPTKNFNKIIIIYYPVKDKENVDNKYYHEYYVPYKSIEYVMNKYWNRKDIEFIGVNVRDKINLNKINSNDSLLIVSADFSHNLEFNNAMDLENRAAHSIMFRRLNNNNYNNIIDHKLSFKKLYENIPDNYQFQWIGRTRSPGGEGVGYLSFLLRDINIRPLVLRRNNKLNINLIIIIIILLLLSIQIGGSGDIGKGQHLYGYYVTVYDKNMNARECLGQYNTNISNSFIKEVIEKSKTTSRLTNGKYIDIPITNYTITYLYKDNYNDFIRGYHAIRLEDGALYLPDVFLENTFDNGDWITNDSEEWPPMRPPNLYSSFNLDSTLEKLKRKGGTSINKIILYGTSIRHYKYKNI